MEAYPSDYVEHNLPLLVLSGLSSESNVVAVAEDYGRGLEISSDLPLVEDATARQIAGAFRKAADNCRGWNNGASRGRTGLIGFETRFSGRNYQLPARKAQPPPDSPRLEASEASTESTSKPKWVLHSPLSPLSPGSSTFPDGVMSPHWVAKHQHHVPACFISFFDFRSDPSRNSLNDNQVKSVINNAKGILARSDLKTRFAAILIGDESIVGSSDMEERLANIRRSTNLDSRNGIFYLPPRASSADIDIFAETVLTALQPLCVEYYRDLTKHTRRKKNRGTIPPPTAPPTRGTSQTLAALGWGIRYDFKLGVFAEFRQEMESALRHYQSAIEALLGSDGIFESTPSWSPRWDEARILADTIALRIIRCLLWSGSTSSAEQSWDNYRFRVKDIIDRRGKGSSNYGWEAWESQWAKSMAQLIQRADLPVFAGPKKDKETGGPAPAIFAAYAPVEKAVPVGERLPPWAHLHHPGYWHHIAYRHALVRRRYAHNIPEDDRTPPNQLPASAMAKRHQTYETFLCAEPHIEYPLHDSQIEGYDHSAEILGHINSSLSAFEKYNQRRTVERLQLEVSKELMRTARHDEAFRILRPLWENLSWRVDQYWNLVSDVARTLRECARVLANVESLVATTYELYSNVFSDVSNERLDLLQCTANVKSQKAGKAKIQLSGDTVSSFLSTTAAFAVSAGNSGETLALQITLESTARQSCQPVQFKQVEVVFENEQYSLIVRHNANADNKKLQASQEVDLRQLSLSTKQGVSADEAVYEAHTDLVLSSGQTIVLECPMVFRAVGDVAIRYITTDIETDAFQLSYTSPPEIPHQSKIWWMQGHEDRAKDKRLARDSVSKIKILPRPPKMEIRVLDAERQLYTDETVTLEFEVANNEDEETISTLEVRLMSRSGDAPVYRWISPEDPSITESSDPQSGLDDLPGYAVGNLKPGEKRLRSLTFAAPSLASDLVLEAKILYHLVSDRETPVSKLLSGILTFTSAFEANYDFTPRIHPDPWPTFFGVHSISSLEETDAPQALGLTQRWRLTARLASFAEETLAVEDVDLKLHTPSNDSLVKISRDTAATGPLPIAPHEMHEHTFTIDMTKLSLEDRRASSLDMTLTVTWKRAATSDRAPEAVTTTLLMPALPVPNAEPRILLSAYPSKQPDLPYLLHLDYVLENPTMHFLTFDLTMEASDDFAFSGAKFGSVNLLPLARTTVRYTILPLIKGKWITPGLKITDRFFGKQLRVLAAEGSRLEKGGKGEVGVWVDDDDDDDE